jgi:hypothetical protein
VKSTAHPSGSKICNNYVLRGSVATNSTAIFGVVDFRTAAENQPNYRPIDGESQATVSRRVSTSAEEVDQH